MGDPNKLPLSKKENELFSMVASILYFDTNEEQYHRILSHLGWYRPWRYKPDILSWENALFQFLHIILALAIFTVPFLYSDKWYAWLIGSGIYATIREYLQYISWDWKEPMIQDRLFDIAFIMIGSQIMFWGLR